MPNREIGRSRGITTLTYPLRIEARVRETESVITEEDVW